jgi:hypothetical protein
MEMQETGELAEYFGVSWSPNERRSSTRRTPVRSRTLTSGSQDRLLDSPGPLQESMQERKGALRQASDDMKPTHSDTPTWEELYSIQTRAMLELRVSTSPWFLTCARPRPFVLLSHSAGTLPIERDSTLCAVIIDGLHLHANQGANQMHACQADDPQSQ